jgi:hypothetical protein
MIPFGRLRTSAGVVLALTVCVPTPARDIVVDPAGAGDYTKIQTALDSARAGDRIRVKAGVYKEKLVFRAGGNATLGPVSLEPAGAGESAVLDGQGVAGANMILIENLSHITIRGLEIRNNLDVKDGSGIRVEGAGRSLRFEGNRIHAIRGRNAMGITIFGTSATPVEDLIVADNEIYDCDPAPSEALALNGNVRRFQVTGNRVHDVNNIGIVFIGGEAWTGAYVAHDGLCANNTVWRARSSYGGGYGAGVYVDGARDIVVENNRVYECDLGIEVGAENPGLIAHGIAVRRNLLHNNDKAGLAFGGYKKSVGRVADCVFVHNVLYRNQTLHDGNGELWLQYGANNTVQNNIVIAGPQAILVSSDAGALRATLDHNCYHLDAGAGPAAPFVWNGTSYASFEAWRQGTGNDAHSLFESPRLSDPAKADFRPGADSPCIDRGANVGLPFLGEAPDIGAFEFAPFPPGGAGRARSLRVY